MGGCPAGASVFSLMRGVIFLKSDIGDSTKLEQLCGTVRSAQCLFIFQLKNIIRPNTDVNTP